VTWRWALCYLGGHADRFHALLPLGVLGRVIQFGFSGEFHHFHYRCYRRHGNVVCAELWHDYRCIALVTTLRSPMFLAVLVGSVILVRLVCVQYWIWTKERDARIKAEETITQLEQRRAILDAGKPYPRPARARRPHLFSRE
jgi:hypothetical protein